MLLVTYYASDYAGIIGLDLRDSMHSPYAEFVLSIYGNILLLYMYASYI